MKSNRIISILAITINVVAIFYKLMLGARAGWEAMLPIVATGLVLTIVALVIQRNKMGWIAAGTAALSVLLFFLG